MPTTPRRILITGAAGFVGHHLSVVLAASFPEARLFTQEFDITDPTQVSTAVSEAAPDACLHLAAISTNAMAAVDESHAWTVNLHGSLHLAQAILRHAPDCQLLFVSSADAYGASFRSGSKLNESAALAPLNLYAATKAAADLALGAMAEKGLRVVRLRPSNHTGPHQSSALVVAAFARQVARIEAGLQQPVIEVGNLEPRRDFLDVRDVCAAYVAVMARQDVIAPGAIFNIASGEARRVGDVLNALIAIAGVTAEIRVDPGRTRSTDVPLAWCDAARAQAQLGWTPGTPWQQTLHNVLDDWRHRIAADPESRHDP
jgi:nucleoside-diphosphate-sugar epimerase